MTNEDTDHSSDLSGGRASIAGYVFQLILSVGLVADAVATESGVEPADSDLDFLFSAIRKKGVDVERFDADAVVWGALNNDPNIVVQIKYTAVQKTIAPAELLKVCVALNEQVTKVENTLGNVDHVLLMTNRKLSIEAEKKYALAKEQGERPEAWNDAAWSTLARLDVRYVTGMSGAFQTVEEFGAHFGARTDESNTSADSFLGKLLRKISLGQNARISREAITEAIVGSAKANFLYSEASASHSRAEIDAFCNRYGDNLNEIGKAARTDLVSEIGEHALSSSLIAVIGEGGDGKTFSALQWLQSRLTPGAPINGSLATVLEARNFTDSSVRSGYRNWLGLKGEHDFWPTHHEDVIRVLSRCKIASIAGSNSARNRNDEVPKYFGPLFAIVIDGIDELSSLPSEGLRTLLNYFASENQLSKGSDDGPKAILVVTCRTTQELNRALSISGLSSDAHPLPYATVTASTFSERELITEAFSFDKEIGQRLSLALLESRTRGLMELRNSALSPPFARIEGHSASIIGASISVNPAGESIAKALLHPILWRCFKRLPSPAERASVLNEDPNALNFLASRFLAWSIEKCRLRNSFGGRYEVRNTVAHLIRVGTSAFQQTHTSQFDMSLWNSNYEHANSHPVGGQLGAELASSGVIVINQDTATWSWRHGFVGELFGAQSGINNLYRWAVDQ